MRHARGHFPQAMEVEIKGVLKPSDKHGVRLFGKFWTEKNIDYAFGRAHGLSLLDDAPPSLCCCGNDGNCSGPFQKMRIARVKCAAGEFSQVSHAKSVHQDSTAMRQGNGNACAVRGCQVRPSYPAAPPMASSTMIRAPFSSRDRRG